MDAGSATLRQADLRKAIAHVVPLPSHLYSGDDNPYLTKLTGALNEIMDVTVSPLDRCLGGKCELSEKLKLKKMWPRVMAVLLASVLILAGEDTSTERNGSALASSPWAHWSS